jgi:hypothetical protein
MTNAEESSNAANMPMFFPNIFAKAVKTVKPSLPLAHVRQTLAGGLRKRRGPVVTRGVRGNLGSSNLATA